MPTCETCGAFVSQNFARVFGDNDDTVTECVNCSRADGDEGSSAHRA